MERAQRTRTHNQSAYEILDAIATKIEVGVCVCELSKRQSGLLFADATAGEIRVAQRAWSGVGGVVKLEALMEVLHASSVIVVSLVNQTVEESCEYRTV